MVLHVKLAILQNKVKYSRTFCARQRKKAHRRIDETVTHSLLLTENRVHHCSAPQLCNAKPTKPLSVMTFHSSHTFKFFSDNMMNDEAIHTWCQSYKTFL